LSSFEEDAELSDWPGLQAVASFARMVADVAWFGRLAAELESDEIDWAERYLQGLGFPDVEVAPVADWEEAEAAARNPDWNSDWWEAEEQLRAALLADAVAKSDEETVMLALTHVTNQASEAVLLAAEAAAARFGVDDEALIRAAAGAATQACYHAALVLAAEADEDHPFALKYRLYEAGRWPLGVVGRSFNLF
jgi:hypothetical protein